MKQRASSEGEKELNKLSIHQLKSFSGEGELISTETVVHGRPEEGPEGVWRDRQGLGRVWKWGSREDLGSICQIT